jgi:hypothetical protein
MPYDGTSVSAAPETVRKLAERLVEYVVLANDPAVPLAAADFWAHSVTYYRDAAATAEALAAGNAHVADALRAVAGEPQSGRYEARLIDALTAELTIDGDRAAEAGRVLDRCDENVYVRYHLGLGYQPATPPVELAEAAGLSSLRAPAPAGEPLVVIGLRDRTGGARARNLLACLAALRDQSLVPAIVVVETDSEPRWRELIEPLVDRYIFARHDGPYNKSWGANVGVVHGAPEASSICVLDADILPDRDFVARNVTRLRDGEYDAHLPFEILTAMDAPASSRAIRSRCAAGLPDVPAEEIRALLLRDVPGACLWIRREFYERLGGLDERFQGWGGEDDDFLARMQAGGRVRRYDDRLLHLAHPRPAMVDAQGRPFNAHLKPLTWTAAEGFGRLSGPSGSK